MFHTYRRAFRKNYINCVFCLFVCTFDTHAYLTKRHPTQVCAVHSWRKYVLFCLDLENGSFSMIIFGTPSNHWVDLYVIFFDSSVMRCFFYWDGNGPCCWWCDASLGPKQPSGKRKSELVLTLKGSPTESTISIQKIGFSTDTRSFLEENQKKYPKKSEWFWYNGRLGLSTRIQSQKKSLPCGTLKGDVSITGLGKIRGLARGKLLDIFIIASFITKSVATIWWKRQMQSKTNDGDWQQITQNTQCSDAWYHI